MCKLVGYDRRHHLLFQKRRLLAHQQAGLSESNEPPVFHGSCQEVWDGYQVWKKQKKQEKHQLKHQTS